MPTRVSEHGPREIKLSVGAALAVERARGSHDRFAHVFEGIQWLISRNPEIGDAFRFTQGGRTLTGRLYRFTGNDAALPDVIVGYQHDDETVTITAVRCVEHGLTRVL